ncbi:quinone oxidoreductase family protein [Hwanghaeella sp. LZ110]|uniref:quinone oxidoreductase family protein n=1 Tax=Hwanghaeella sp. LZ110 TaxID=3402810 RepID=UPI003B66C85C
MNTVMEIHTTGGIEQFKIGQRAVEVPGPGEIRLRHQAIGVNFIDIYHRIGAHPVPLPGVLGVEGAGIIEAVGEGVTDLKIGDAIAYAGALGAYAKTRLLPAWRAVRLPNAARMDVVGGNMLRALTAYMLLTLVHPVSANSTIFVHAAAGGLGIILTRWAKHFGATVIGTVSTEGKADIATANGVDAVIVGREADIAARVNELTQGHGVDLVVDGIGGDMVRQSLRCVRRFGMVANIGWVAGPTPALQISELGDAFLSKPSVMSLLADSHFYATGAKAVFDILGPDLGGSVGGTYALEEVARAQFDLENGQTTGSLVLIPSA